MRTAQQIKDEASKRFNVTTQSNGLLARHDVIDFLAQLPQESDKRTELDAFLDEMPFVTGDVRNKLSQDLESYDL